MVPAPVRPRAARPRLARPAVGDDFEATLRFWLDRGVSGFRVDVAYGLFKDAGLRDNPGAYSPTLFGHGPEQAMTWNQPEVHDVWRRWRAVCDEYPGTMLVGEVCLADLDQVALYSRPDELHQSFSFRLLKSGWDAAAFADGVQSALDAFATVGAPVSWVLGNHDKDRQVTRFGGGAVGTARARAAALLLMALPGSPYLYAGDELALPQAAVPDEAKRDPIFHRSGGTRAGRDGCRVPMPGTSPPASASPPTAQPTRGCRSPTAGTGTRSPGSPGTAAPRSPCTARAGPARRAPGPGVGDGHRAGRRRRPHRHLHRGRRDRALRAEHGHRHRPGPRRDRAAGLLDVGPRSRGAAAGHRRVAARRLTGPAPDA